MVSASFAKKLLILACFAAECASLNAFSPEVEEELRAQSAIKRYLHETHPWWTCEYTAEILPREGRLLVHRVVLVADEKCSRSRRRERFDVLYDPKRDKIVEVRYPDAPYLTNGSE
jgi:hypothetical protein